MHTHEAGCQKARPGKARHKVFTHHQPAWRWERKRKRKREREREREGKGVAQCGSWLRLFGGQRETGQDIISAVPSALPCPAIG